MLSITDIVELPGLEIRLVAGHVGDRNAIRWLHISELEDPTPELDGGELLLTGGLGLGATAASQRRYVRRLAEHGAAGLGIAVGEALPQIPAAVVAEADALGFPVLLVPASTPFNTLTKLTLPQLAADPVAQALEVHEQLIETVLGGGGPRDLLRILGGTLGGTLVLSDDHGTIAEHHSGEHHSGERHELGDDALALPIGDGPGAATLRAAREERPFGDYERLVLRHGQNALALELARRQAVLAAELRLAGDLFDDLEQERLDLRETARRLAAFGLDANRSHAALLGVPGGDANAALLRDLIARHLDRQAISHLSAARHNGVAFLVNAPSEEALFALAEALVRAAPGMRVAVGRSANGLGLGRSLLEARAALDASGAAVVSYRDLSSFELLLSVPVPVLEAYVDRVLGPTASNGWLVETLSVLLESGCRWKDAAEQLGVHRHTLRYRMDRLQEQTGRHPDQPGQRMELWLAVKAIQAIAMRGGGSYEPRTDRV
ncbi:PucR family transcriptional regulator [Conexibacter woesei]|uniref:PucR family transcriptional regulator n=1 Tax=Conexibacter woesei TaxID=191495 RepID=UPI0002FA5C3B|nr:PucR family transcriptional regulator [Conexibacter woesei]